MIICKECDDEFMQTDIVYECEECDEPVCKGCKEEHAKTHIEFDDISEECEACGNPPTLQCEKCDAKICNSCESEHIDDCSDDIEFQEYEYDKYTDMKMIEKLKE